MADLFSLAKNNKFEELRVMFNKGIGVKAADEQGRTLLHHAAAANAAEVIDLLLERGASWNVVDKQGYTVRFDSCSITMEAAIDQGSAIQTGSFLPGPPPAFFPLRSAPLGLIYNLPLCTHFNFASPSQTQLKSGHKAP